MDSGSAARFFTECRFDGDDRRLIYAGKAPPTERVFHCGVCGTIAVRAERETHKHDREDFSHLKEHPTVKPVSLMTHLAKLLCPLGGLILDPFAGTGSTGVGAMRAGRNSVLIEQEASHAETIRFRVARESA